MVFWSPENCCAWGFWGVRSEILEVCRGPRNNHDTCTAHGTSPVLNRLESETGRRLASKPRRLTRH